MRQARFVCPGYTLSALLIAAASAPAHASLLPPELEDGLANVIAWVALIVAPIIGILVFWFLHIMPEKIAEQRKHPQAKAIQTLCILSLFFGGLLWPLAWLWAYTKPVFHKMAYGTDVHEELDELAEAEQKDHAELERLRLELAALEARVGASGQAGKGEGA